MYLRLLILDILVDELDHGHAGKIWVEKVKEAVKGSLSKDRRANVGRLCESVAEQVDCLIDLASDPSILGRSWVGFQPWC